jgi:murein DD-endopeptidase MepM/ murein hydrolase activator NlpD
VIRLAALIGSAVVLSAVILSTGLASAAAPLGTVSTAADAVIVRITVPGQNPVALGQISWPENSSAELQSFAYPDDGSIVSVGVSHATVSAQAGETATAQAHADTVALSLFGGEIVASQVTAQASAGASRRSAGGDISGSTVSGLRALGQDVAPTPGSSVPLADWGTLDILSQSTASRRGRSSAARGTVAALRVRLASAHDGLAAGSEILVGSVDATAAATPGANPRRTTTPPHGVVGSPPVGTPVPTPPEPSGGATIPGGPVRTGPPNVHVRLSGQGYVFPVYGTVSFGDSFGAPRPDVPGGWHHGEDLFAPKGTPVLAVADGTVYSIGWNDIGGYRLWLRDRQGNQFYYAHLSAYSPLAVEGDTVEAGDVLGFVGNTGDADGGPPHLHFEIHPSGLLGLGYDGVVAPYPFLVAWQHRQDVFFASGRVYVPKGHATASLPEPGAVLLDAHDIAATSGLVPGALERALRALPAKRRAGG